MRCVRRDGEGVVSVCCLRSSRFVSRITCACYIPGPALPSIPSPPFIPGAFFRALTCVSRLLSSTPHPLSPSRCIALHRAASRKNTRSFIQCQPFMWMQISTKARVLESPGTRLHKSRSTALLFLALFLAGLSVTLNYFSLIFVTAGTWERRSHRITHNVSLSFVYSMACDT